MRWHQRRRSPDNRSGDTYSLPITFTIYNIVDGDTVGSHIARVTQTFNIPYRPSWDSFNCSNGGWFDADSSTCPNGVATIIVFDFSSLAVTLPDSVIYGASFNTSLYGAQPFGTETDCYTTVPTEAGCPYDALNVAVTPSVTVGSQVHPGKAFLDSTWTLSRCDSGAVGTGTFQLDSPTCDGWTGYVPAVQFTTGTPPATGNFAWLYNFVRQFYAIRGHSR